LEVDAAGEVGKAAVADVLGSLNSDLLAAGELAGPLEVLHQSGAPERFALKLVPGPDSLEAADERQPIDKERFPGLKAAERMQQVDGPAAADAKELFDERAVDHRGGKGAEGVQNLGKVKQPLGLGGRWRDLLFSSTLVHRCADGKFLQCKVRLRRGHSQAYFALE